MTKIREPIFADFIPYLPKYWAEMRENQGGIYFAAILSIGIELFWKNRILILNFSLQHSVLKVETTCPHGMCKVYINLVFSKKIFPGMISFCMFSVVKTPFKAINISTLTLFTFQLSKQNLSTLLWMGMSE